MSACCHAAGAKSPTFLGRVRSATAWLLPAALFALVPKCPACLAAHIALWTGLGLSVAAAASLRWALIGLGLLSLLTLTVRHLWTRRTSS